MEGSLNARVDAKREMRAQWRILRTYTESARIGKEVKEGLGRGKVPQSRRSSIHFRKTEILGSEAGETHVSTCEATMLGIKHNSKLCCGFGRLVTQKIWQKGSHGG